MEGERGSRRGPDPQPKSSPQAICAVHSAPYHHVRLQWGHQGRPHNGRSVETHEHQIPEGLDQAQCTLRFPGPQQS